MFSSGTYKSVSLLIQRSDGNVVSASEEDFYRYTTKRWLANEAFEAAQRYRKFNIQRLVDVAARSDRTKLKKCVSVMKYREGQFNKTFLIIFDNGSEVVAKLPNPNSGPNVLTIASEVATMDYARDILGLRVPRVLDWSSDPNNQVGCEYIIMEKVEGTALGDVWYNLSDKSKQKIIRQVVDIEAKFAAFSFPSHGCLYYTRDLPAKYHYNNQFSLPGDDSKRFCIGPLVDRQLWSDGRSEMKLGRGPWRRLSDFALAMGENERAWTEKYVTPRMNYFKSYTDQETPQEYIKLIEKYMRVAAQLIRTEADTANLLQPILWHCDLHLNNIYIDVDMENISGIIDWQGSSIAPLCIQAKFPRMIEHPSPVPLGGMMPEKPDDDGSLSKAEYLRLFKLYKSAFAHKYYEVTTATRNPSHYAAICHNQSGKLPIIEPLVVITGCWSAREVFRFRASLMNVVDRWGELYPSINCPISFTEEERRIHDEELENRDHVERVMEEYQKLGILPLDGTVDPEDYDAVRKRSEEQKKLLLSVAEDDEKAWIEKVWPYQDRPKEA
ncbi:hypothetical protein LOZ36_002702 [Ophidiomyces ophidiicola]|nr:hypothetical protein LOZ36_002702 [Ophidiomyces ophidiicola]